MKGRNSTGWWVAIVAMAAILASGCAVPAGAARPVQPTLPDVITEPLPLRDGYEIEGEISTQSTTEQNFVVMLRHYQQVDAGPSYEFTGHKGTFQFRPGSTNGSVTEHETYWQSRDDVPGTVGEAIYRFDHGKLHLSAVVYETISDPGEDVIRRCWRWSVHSNEWQHWFDMTYLDEGVEYVWHDVDDNEALYWVVPGERFDEWSVSQRRTGPKQITFRFVNTRTGTVFQPAPWNGQHPVEWLWFVTHAHEYVMRSWDSHVTLKTVEYETADGTTYSAESLENYTSSRWYIRLDGYNAENQTCWTGSEWLPCPWFNLEYSTERLTSYDSRFSTLKAFEPPSQPPGPIPTPDPSMTHTMYMPLVARNHPGPNIWWSWAWHNHN